MNDAVSAGTGTARPLGSLLKLSGQVISVLFHPVFVPVYIIAFLLVEHPFAFAGFTNGQKLMVLIQATAMYLFFPLVTVLLLKALHFISSIQLHTQKDRIIPLVACGIWYFWIWYVWRNLPDYPAVAVKLALAIWICSWLSLMINVKMKISLHAISMGILCGFLLWLAFTQPLQSGIYLSIGFLLTGLVLTARLLVSDHQPAELYGGLLLGCMTMISVGVLL